MKKFFYRIFIILFAIISIEFEATAGHLMGGNLEYKYLGFTGGNYQYRVTIKVFRCCNGNCSNAPFRDDLWLGVYNHNPASPNANKTLFAQYNIAWQDTFLVQPPPPGDSCVALPFVCVEQARYVQDISIPGSTSGYHLVAEDFARHEDLENIISNGANLQGMTWYGFIPSNSFQNNTPNFADSVPVPFICTGDTFDYSNIAIDPDGDILKYSFVHPYSSPQEAVDPFPTDPLLWPIDTVPWELTGGFKTSTPFGNNGYASITSSTGLTKYYVPPIGAVGVTKFYVIAMQINEYRGSNLVGRTRRDLQLVFLDCDTNPAPNLAAIPDSGFATKEFNITEGDSVCIPISYTDPNNDSLFLTSIGVTPPATLPNAKGKNTVSSQFCWNTDCGQMGTYNFIVKVSDKGCPVMTVYDEDTINVLRFKGPTAINGSDSVCAKLQGVSYSVTGSTGSTFQWIITGGTKASGGNTNSITVNWNDTSPGKIKLVEVSKHGCAADTVTKNIIIKPLPVINAGNDSSFCSGNSIIIGTDSVGGNIYSWSPTTGLDNSSKAKPSLTLTNTGVSPVTTNYILTATLNSCVQKDTVAVTVNPLPVSNAGPDVNFCSGEKDTLGAASLVNHVYLWSPAAGLNDSTVSDPIVTLINSTTTPDTFKYVVKTTNTLTTCYLHDTVRVIVRPLPVSNAGVDKAFCSKDSITIGAATTTGYTYSWSPATGLNSSTISEPGVKLTNADTIPDTLNYIVTTTLNSCVTNDTARIIVKPLPIADAGKDTSYCSGGSSTLGTAPKINHIYSWSPSTGLSNTAVSNPVVSLVDTVGVPDTLQYIVTVTDTITGCISKDTVKVIVRPYPIPNAGTDVSFCSGDTAIIGTAATTNYTYLWTPVTGLSDSTDSDPALTLKNLTTTPDTFNYIVTTTIYSCSKQDTVRVIVRPLPVSNAGADVVFCSEKSDTIGTSSTINHTYLWSPITGLNNSTISDPILSLINNSNKKDTIQYIVTTTLYGCITNDTVRVIVNPLPKADKILGSVSVCPGVLGVPYWIEGDSGSIYVWSIQGKGSIASGQGNDTITVNWDTTSVAQIFAVETDTNGCAGDTISLTVTINVLLEPAQPNGPDTLCDRYKNSVNYYAFPAPGSIFTWSIQGGTIISGNGTYSVYVNWNGVGSGLLWYHEGSITLDTVCDGISDTLFVTVFKSPVATGINGTFKVCEDTSKVSYSIDGLTGSNFIWFIDGDTINTGINLDSITVVWDTNGVYEIKVTEITPNGCIEFLKDSVIVNKTPGTSSIKGDTIICFMPDSIYSYSVTGLPLSSYKWQVSGGKILSNPDTANAITVKWDSAGVKNITVTETSKDSCIGSPVSLTVIVNKTPTAKIINGNFYLCEENSNLKYTVNGLSGSIYFWTYNGGFNVINDSSSTLTVDWDTAGTFKLTVVEVSTDGCVGDSIDSLVQVNPLPETSKINGDTAICFVPGDEYPYFVSGFTGSYFDWKVIGGTIMSLIDTTDSISVRWDSLGIGVISLVENSKDTCVGDTIKLTVFVNEVPSAKKINGSFYMCEKNKGMSYLVSGLSGSTYFWNVTGASNVINDSSNTLTVDWDSAGSYLISVVEISDKYCIGDTVDSIVVVNPLPKTSLIFGDSIICPPNNINHVYLVNGFDSSTFFWNITGGNITEGQGTDSVIVSWDTLSGYVNLTATETTKDTCPGNSVVKIVLLDGPKINFMYATDRETNDKEVEINWDFENRTIYPDSLKVYKKIHGSVSNWDSLITVKSEDSYYFDKSVSTSQFAYDYTVSGEDACRNIVKIDPHNTILLEGIVDENNESLKIYWNRYYGWADGVNRYEIWRKIDNKTSYQLSEFSVDSFITFNNGADGFEHCFRIKAIEKSGNGTSSFSNALCLKFLHSIKIPNVFTPNNDGTNDTWIIHNIELYPDSRVQIFNRWGREIYNTTGYKNDWAGKNLNEDTYFYIVRIKNSTESYTGYLRLIR